MAVRAGRRSRRLSSGFQIPLHGDGLSRGRRSAAQASDDGAYCPVRLDVQLISQQGRVNLGLPQRTGPVPGGDQRIDETRGDARTVRVQSSQPSPPLHRPLPVAAPRGCNDGSNTRGGRKPSIRTVVNLCKPCVIGWCYPPDFADLIPTGTPAAFIVASADGFTPRALDDEPLWDRTPGALTHSS